MKTVLLLVVLGLVGYAIYAQYYTKTPVEDSVPKRVWASLAGAAGALGGLISSWLHSSGAVSP